MITDDHVDVDGRAPLKPRGRLRRFGVPGAAALVALLIGVGVGRAGAGGDASKKRADSLQTQLTSAKSQMATDQTNLQQLQSSQAATDKGLQDQLTQARSDLSHAQGIADQKATAKLSAAQAAGKAALASAQAASQAKVDAEQATLKQQQQAVQQREAMVTAREQKVGTAEQQQAASTVTGNGTYRVGVDIQPGTYVSGGPDSSGAGNCYWARLGSADTSNILDNNNTSGQSVVTVLPSDYGLEVAGCQDFHKQQ